MSAVHQKTPAMESFWAAARHAVPSLPQTLDADIWFFGDSPELAMSLAELVLSGSKRATAGLEADMIAQNLPIPRVRGLSLVTDFHDNPLMILRTIHVDVLPFQDVGADFAAAEGEGDGSLAYWQRVHTDYFTRDCTRIGQTWRPDMRVICEWFDLLYPNA